MIKSVVIPLLALLLVVPSVEKVCLDCELLV